MKKTFLFILSLLFAFNMYADKKAIRLSPTNSPKPGRSIVILPTASIDGQVLTIEFTEATASQVTVKGQSTQVVVYNGAFTSEQVVITLPSLPEGDYCLEIEQGDYVYIGEFEIAD